MGVSNDSAEKWTFTDFGFGGFLGYGKGMPVCLVVNEELKKGMKSDG